jgi:hypothetical protein
MSAEYDKMFNIWIYNSNKVPATYGNVSLYSQQKADLNQITTTRLGVNCDSSANAYTADISGSLWVRGDTDISGNINSPWLDASLNLRALDTVVVKTTGNQTIGGEKTLTGTLTSSQSMVITGATTKEMKVENVGGSLSSSMSANGVRTTGYFWGQAQGGNSYRGTTTANTNFYITNDELSYLTGITSSVQTQLNNTLTLDTAQIITGAKRFTGDVSFNTGSVLFQNGLTSNGAIALNSTLVGATAIRMANGSIQTAGGIYFPSSDFNRKIVLAPVASNEFQNYSIGTNTTNKLIQFMVPDESSVFRFSNGASTTTKTDIMDITPSGIAMKDTKTISLSYSGSNTIVLDPNAGLTMYGGTITLYNSAGTDRYIWIDGFTNAIDTSGTEIDFRGGSLDLQSCSLNITNNAGLRYGGWTTIKLDLSGCHLQLESQFIHRSNSTTITGTNTITKPYNQFYAVEATGTAYTITLPTITSADLGKEIMFRKVRQTGTAVSISFIGNGSQRVYSTALAGGTTAQALMTSTTYIVRLLPLPDPAAGAGLFGWFST